MLSRFGVILLISGVFGLCFGWGDKGDFVSFWNNTKTAYDKAKESCKKVAVESNRVLYNAKEDFKQSNWVPYEKRDNDNDGYPNGQDRWPDDSRYH